MNLALRWVLLLPAAMAGLAACDRDNATPPQNAVVTSPQTAPAQTRWLAPDAAASTTDPALTPTGFDPAMLIRRNYYVVFDASGSMAEAKCSGSDAKIIVAKRALAEFIGKLPADANLGLSVFDNAGLRELIPLGPIRGGAAGQVIASIDSGGGTPLAESIRAAYAALTAQGRRQLGYGEFHLVVVTDGEATGENPRNIVNTVLADSRVVLHTIGFCIGENHSLNQPGRVVYRAADNPAELARGLADVLAESPNFDVKSFK